jgi:hypothetical protein
MRFGAPRGGGGLMAAILASNSANLAFQPFFSPVEALVSLSFSLPPALVPLLPVGFSSGWSFQHLASLCPLTLHPEQNLPL